MTFSLSLPKVLPIAQPSRRMAPRLRGLQRLGAGGERRVVRGMRQVEAGAGTAEYVVAFGPAADLAAARVAGSGLALAAQGHLDDPAGLVVAGLGPGPRTRDVGSHALRGEDHVGA